MAQTTTIPFQFSVQPATIARFSNVPSDSIQRIARNIFEPSELANLLEEADATITEHNALPRRIESYEGLVKALLLYFRILSDLIADAGDISQLHALANGAFVYLGRLFDHNQQHSWTETLEYHLAFHKERCREMSNGDFTGWSSLRRPQLSASEEIVPSKWHADLPPEILQSIFDYAIIPDILLEPSLVPRPDSLWTRNLRTKKNIVLVSKTWYSCGIQFLYQHVSIRRLSEFYAFLGMLESSEITVRPLVQTFTVSCFIGEEDAFTFERALVKIFVHCENMSRFTFSSTYERLPICSALRHLSPALTQLRLDPPNELQYHIIIGILERLGPHLTFLLIRPGRVETADIISGCPVQLRDLQTLICQFNSHGLSQQLSVIKQYWKMPRLKTLTITVTDWYVWHRVWKEPHVAIPFFAAHSRHLRFLDLTDHVCGAMNPMDWEELLNKCPLLEHLVVDHDSFALPGRLDSTRLKCLSLRHLTTPPRDGFVDHIDQSPAEFYQLIPSLVLVRHLWALPAYLSEWLQDLPYSPGWDAPDDRVVDLYRFTRVHGVENVYLDTDVNSLFGGEDESDDESYEPSSDSEAESDSVYSSDSEPSSIDIDEELALEVIGLS